MRRVLVGGKLHSSGLKILQETADIELDYVEAISTESLLPMIYEADALLLRTQPLPANVVRQCNNLKIVSRHGVGYDAVAVEALNERRIPLAIVGDVTTIPVAEHTLMLMLNLAKRLRQYDSATRGANAERPWSYRNSLEATELHSKTLLVVGFGRIGRRVAHLAQAFGMKVCAFDSMLNAADIPSNLAIAKPDLESALRSADFVTLHIPGSSEPLLGSQELALMKPTAIIVNTARGGLVDESALITALQARKLRAAGLDVFQSEPPDITDPLIRHEDVALTPHSAAMTEECGERMAVISAQNIVDFFAGHLDPSLVVNASSVDMSPTLSC